MKSTIKVLSLILLVSASSISAQTVNTGTLYITPNTIMGTVADFDNRPTGTLNNDGEFYVYANFNNDGIVGFTPSENGYTRFQGFLNQKFTGSQQSNFQNTLFSNNNPQPAFELYSKISVANQADFFQGIVQDDVFGGLFIFENNGFHVNVDDDSHVDGHVRKNGNTAFQYPIGDGSQYRYAAISEPSNLTDAFTGKYFLENSNPLYPHKDKAGIIGFIDDKEYWTVDKTTANSDVFLTLSWDEDTTPAAIYAVPYEEIHIVRWDETQKLWVDEGGIADATKKVVTTIINPLLGYGVFTLARVRTNAILPCGGRGVVVYNAVSPNDDGLNDHFIIDGIEACPNNTVEVYNRWGVKVYETTAYNTSGNVFRGMSEGRVTVSKNEKLPTGTYFYIINFINNDAKNSTKKGGYLYINDK